MSYGNLAAPRGRPCHCLYRYPVPGHCLCISCLGAYNRVMEEIRVKAEMRREAEEMRSESEDIT